jgi:hypothetical protein
MKLLINDNRGDPKPRCCPLWSLELVIPTRANSRNFDPNLVYQNGSSVGHVSGYSLPTPSYSCDVLADCSHPRSIHAEHTIETARLLFCIVSYGQQHYGGGNLCVLRSLSASLFSQYSCDQCSIPAVSNHYVRGYTTRNGTLSSLTSKRTPNATKFANWPTRGNINLYAGSAGTKSPF